MKKGPACGAFFMAARLLFPERFSRWSDQAKTAEGEVPVGHRPIAKTAASQQWLCVQVAATLAVVLLIEGCGVVTAVGTLVLAIGLKTVTAPFPDAPTTEDLRIQFLELNDYKMLSDQIIYQPGKFKLLFGNGAAFCQCRNLHICIGSWDAKSVTCQMDFTQCWVQ